MTFCPAGSPIGNIDLRIRSASGGAVSLPLRTLNRLEEGDTILYRPLLRGYVEKNRVAPVLCMPRRAQLSPPDPSRA